MDRFAEKQAQILQRRSEFIGRYPDHWQHIISEWKEPGPDQVWLIYAANYLFRTASVGWALDPLTINWRLKSQVPLDFEALKGLSFVLLTHQHSDHLDLDMLGALRDYPIKWVVPAAILPKVLAAGISRDNILIPEPARSFRLREHQITPFDGLHWEQKADGTLRGVPATGYLVEWMEKRWLFPGDTRTYDPAGLPSFGLLDGVFAHVWLGRGGALQKSPPLTEAFCLFFLKFYARRIILTHLQDFGRDAHDFWDEAHLPALLAGFQAISSETQVQLALTGDCLAL